MISDITFFLFLNKNMVDIYFCVSTHPSRSSPQLMVRPGWFQALATKELRGPSKNAWTDDFGLFSGLDLPVSYVSCRKCIFFWKANIFSCAGKWDKDNPRDEPDENKPQKIHGIGVVFVIETSTVSDSILFYIVGIHFVQPVYNEMSIGFWRLHLLPQ